MWVPDAEANVCMHCNKSQFNVLNRRVNIEIFYSKVNFCLFVLTFSSIIAENVEQLFVARVPTRSFYYPFSQPSL